MVLPRTKIKLSKSSRKLYEVKSQTPSKKKRNVVKSIMSMTEMIVMAFGIAYGTEVVNIPDSKKQYVLRGVRHKTGESFYNMLRSNPIQNKVKEFREACDGKWYLIGERSPSINDCRIGVYNSQNIKSLQSMGYMLFGNNDLWINATETDLGEFYEVMLISRDWQNNRNLEMERERVGIKKHGDVPKSDLDKIENHLEYLNGKFMFEVDDDMAIWLIENKIDYNLSDIVPGFKFSKVLSFFSNEFCSDDLDITYLIPDSISSVLVDCYYWAIKNNLLMSSKVVYSEIKHIILNNLNNFSDENDQILTNSVKGFYEKITDMIKLDSKIIIRDIRSMLMKRSYTLTNNKWYETDSERNHRIELMDKLSKSHTMSLEALEQEAREILSEDFIIESITDDNNTNEDYIINVCSKISDRYNGDIELSADDLILKSKVLINACNYEDPRILKFIDQCDDRLRKITVAEVSLTKDEEAIISKLRYELSRFSDSSDRFTDLHYYAERLSSPQSARDLDSHIIHIKGYIGEVIYLDYNKRMGIIDEAYNSEDGKNTISEYIEANWDKLKTNHFKNDKWDTVLNRKMVDNLVIKRSKCDGYSIKDDILHLFEYKWISSIKDDPVYLSQKQALFRERENRKLDNIIKKLQGYVRVKKVVEIYSDTDVERMANYMNNNSDDSCLNYAMLYNLILKFIRMRFWTNASKHYSAKLDVDSFSKRKPTLGEPQNIDPLKIKKKYIATYLKEKDTFMPGGYMFPKGIRNSYINTHAMLGGYLRIFDVDEIDKMVKFNEKENSRLEFLGMDWFESYKRFFKKFIQKLNEVKYVDKIKEPEDIQEEIKNRYGETIYTINTAPVSTSLDCMCDEHDKESRHKLTNEMSKLIRLNTSVGTMSQMENSRVKNEVASNLVSLVLGPSDFDGKRVNGGYFVTRTGRITKAKLPSQGVNVASIIRGTIEIMVDCGYDDDYIESFKAEVIKKNVNGKDIYKDLDKLDFSEIIDFRKLAKIGKNKSISKNSLILICNILDMYNRGIRICDSSKLMWTPSEMSSIRTGIEQFRQSCEVKDRKKKEDLYGKIGEEKELTVDNEFIKKIINIETGNDNEVKIVEDGSNDDKYDSSDDNSGRNSSSTDSDFNSDIGFYHGKEGTLGYFFKEFRNKTSEYRNFLRIKLDEFQIKCGSDQSLKICKIVIDRMIDKIMSCDASSIMISEFCLFTALDKLLDHGKGLSYASIGKRFAIFRFGYTTDNNNSIIALYDRITGRVISHERISKKQIQSKLLAFPFIIYLFGKSQEMTGTIDSSSDDIHLDTWNGMVEEEMVKIRNFMNEIDNCFINKDYGKLTNTVRHYQEVFNPVNITPTHANVLAYLLEVIYPMLRENNKNLNAVVQMQRYISLTAVSEDFNYEEFASKLVKVIRGKGSQMFYRILVSTQLTTLENVCRRGRCGPEFKKELYNDVVDPFISLSSVNTDNHFISTFYYVQLYEKMEGDVRDNIKVFDEFCDSALEHAYKVRETIENMCYTCNKICKGEDREINDRFSMAGYTTLKTKVISEGKSIRSHSFNSSKEKKNLMKRILCDDKYFSNIKCDKCEDSWLRLECLLCVIILRRDLDDESRSPITYASRKLQICQQLGSNIKCAVAELVNDTGYANAMSMGVIRLDNKIEESDLINSQLPDMNKTTNVVTNFQSEKDLNSIISSMDLNKANKYANSFMAGLRERKIKLKGLMNGDVTTMDNLEKYRNEFKMSIEGFHIDDGVRKAINDTIDKRLNIHNTFTIKSGLTFDNICNGDVNGLQVACKRTGNIYNRFKINDNGAERLLVSKFKELRIETDNICGVTRFNESANIRARCIALTEKLDNGELDVVKLNALNWINSVRPQVIGTVKDIKIMSDGSVSSDLNKLDNYYERLDELQNACSILAEKIEKSLEKLRFTPSLNRKEETLEISRMADTIRFNFQNELMIECYKIVGKMSRYCPNYYVTDKICKKLFDLESKYLKSSMFTDVKLNSCEKICLNMMLYDISLDGVLGISYQSRDQLRAIMCTMDDNICVLNSIRFAMNGMIQDQTHFNYEFSSKEKQIVNHKTKKVITALCEETLVRSDTSILNIASELIENKQCNFKVKIASKQQVGGTRDLTILGVPDKIIQYVSEKTTDMLLEDNKYDFMINNKEKNAMLNQASSNNYKVSINELSFSCSGMLDNKKWGPKHDGTVMMLACENLLESSRFANCVTTSLCFGMGMKQVHMNQSVIKNCVNMVKFKGLRFVANANPDQPYNVVDRDGTVLDTYALIEKGISKNMSFIIIHSLCRNKTYFTREPHMGQGMEHKLSSLYHCGFLALMDQTFNNRLAVEDSISPLSYTIRGRDKKQIVTQVLRSEKVGISMKCSSDDSIINMFVSSDIKHSVAKDLYYSFWAMYNTLGIGINICNSPKSHISQIFAEVYSLFGRSGTVLSPSIKQESAMIAMNCALTSYAENQSVFNMGVDTFCAGASLLMTNLSLYARNVKLLSVRHTFRLINDEEYWEDTNFPNHEGTCLILEAISSLSFKDLLCGFGVILSKRAHAVFKGISNKLKMYQNLSLVDRIYVAALMDSTIELDHDVKLNTWGNTKADNILSDPVKFQYPRSRQTEIIDLKERLGELIDGVLTKQKLVRKLNTMNQRAIDYETSIEKNLQAFQSPSMINSFCSFSQSNVKVMARTARNSRKVNIGNYIESPHVSIRSWKLSSLLEMKEWKCTDISDKDRLDIIRECDKITKLLNMNSLGAERMQVFINSEVSSYTGANCILTSDVKFTTRRVDLNDSINMIKTDTYTACAYIIDKVETMSMTNFSESDLIMDVNTIKKLAPHIYNMLEKLDDEKELDESIVREINTFCRRSTTSGKSSINVILPDVIDDNVYKQIARYKLIDNMVFETNSEAGSMMDYNMMNTDKGKVGEIITIMNQLPSTLFDVGVNQARIFRSTLFNTVIEREYINCRDKASAVLRMLNDILKFMNSKALDVLDKNIFVESCRITNKSGFSGWSDRVTLRSNNRLLQGIVVCITYIENRYSIITNSNNKESICLLLDHWLAFNTRNSRTGKPTSMSHINSFINYPSGITIYTSSTCSTTRKEGMSEMSIGYSNFVNSFNYTVEDDNFQAKKILRSNKSFGIEMGISVESQVVSGNTMEIKLMALNKNIDVDMTRASGNRYVLWKTIKDVDSVTLDTMIDVCSLLVPRENSKFINEFNKKGFKYESDNSSDIQSLSYMFGQFLQVTVTGDRFFVSMDNQIINHSNDTGGYVLSFCDAVKSGSCSKKIIKTTLPLLYRVYNEVNNEYLDSDGLDNEKLKKLVIERCKQLANSLMKSYSGLVFSNMSGNGSKDMAGKVGFAPSYYKPNGVNVKVYIRNDTVYIIDNHIKKAKMTKVSQEFKSLIGMISPTIARHLSGNYVLKIGKMFGLDSNDQFGIAIPIEMSELIDAMILFLNVPNVHVFETTLLCGLYLMGRTKLTVKKLSKKLISLSGVRSVMDLSDDDSDYIDEESQETSADIMMYAMAALYHEMGELDDLKFKIKLDEYRKYPSSATNQLNSYLTIHGISTFDLTGIVQYLKLEFSEYYESIVKDYGSDLERGRIDLSDNDYEVDDDVVVDDASRFLLDDGLDPMVSEEERLRFELNEKADQAIEESMWYDSDEDQF